MNEINRYHENIFKQINILQLLRIIIFVIIIFFITLFVVRCQLNISLAVVYND